MRCKQMLAALLGSLSLVEAAPASIELTPAEKGLRHRTKRQLGGLIQPDIQISNTQITAVDQNLGVISQLAQLAEQQFAALVQSQIQLVTQLETIKNNIRINSLVARFPQVNTVLVTVTNIVDARDTAHVNRRYLLNQLHIDNGHPDQELVVMVTQKEEVTISAVSTVSETATAASTIDLGAVNHAASSSTTTASSGFALPTGGVSHVINLDPNFINNGAAAAPFSPLLFNSSSSLILPFNTSAPIAALVLDDPADIIFPGQHDLLVESLGSLQTDCLQIAADGGADFLNQALQLSLFGSLQEAAAAQLGSLQIGGGVPVIPPSILLQHPDLAQQYSQAVASETAKATVTESAGVSASKTAGASATEESATASETAAVAATDAAHGGRTKGHRGKKGE